jgi:hypothetical protein
LRRIPMKFSLQRTYLSMNRAELKELLNRISP